MSTQLHFHTIIPTMQGCLFSIHDHTHSHQCQRSLRNIVWPPNTKWPQYLGWVGGSSSIWPGVLSSPAFLIEMLPHTGCTSILFPKELFYQPASYNVDPGLNAYWTVFNVHSMSILITKTNLCSLKQEAHSLIKLLLLTSSPVKSLVTKKGTGCILELHCADFYHKSFYQVLIL